MEIVPQGRPEQGKRETINRLIAAAKQEFAAKGLAGARVDEIAQKASVTKQLVYHYFGTKEALFTCVLDQVAVDIMADLLSHDFDRQDPTQAVRSFLDRMFEHYTIYEFLGALAREGISYHEHHRTPGNDFLGSAPALVAKLATVLQRGAESGDFRPGIEPRLFLATAALLMCGGFTNRYSVSALAGFRSDSPEGMKLWHDHAVDFVMTAIRAVPAERL